MTTSTSNLFASASRRSRLAGVKAALVATFVATLTAGFVLHAQLGPAPATQGADQALVAAR